MKRWLWRELSADDGAERDAPGEDGIYIYIRDEMASGSRPPLVSTRSINSICEQRYIGAAAAPAPAPAPAAIHSFVRNCAKGVNDYFNFICLNGV